MNKDQAGGIVERLIYGAVLYLVMRYGPQFGLTAEDGAWLAGGAVAAVGGIYAFIHNRPVSMLNRTAAALPDSARLVIETSATAPRADRQEAVRLAVATVDKVTAKTA